MAWIHDGYNQLEHWLATNVCALTSNVWKKLLIERSFWFYVPHIVWFVSSAVAGVGAGSSTATGDASGAIGATDTVGSAHSNINAGKASSGTKPMVPKRPSKVVVIEAQLFYFIGNIRFSVECLGSTIGVVVGSTLRVHRTNVYWLVPDSITGCG